MIKYFINNLQNRNIFFLYIIISIVDSFVSLLIPILNSIYIDELILEPRFDIIYKIIYLVVATSIIQLFFSYILIKTNISIHSSTSKKMILFSTERLHKLPLDFYYDKNSSAIMQSLTTDTSNIIQYSLTFFSSISINLITLVFSSIFLFKLSKRIFFGACVFSIINLIYYSRFDKKIYFYQRKVLLSQNNLFKNLVTSINNIKNIKINNLSKNKLKSVLSSHKHMYKILKDKSILEYFIDFGSAIISNTSTVFLYLVGGKMLINGEITIGVFLILTNYFTRITSSCIIMLEIKKSYKSNLSSYHRLLEYLETPIEPNGNNIFDAKVNNISLRNINFSYTDKEVIKNRNLEISRGVTLIKGGNGCGKSTLVELLVGLYPSSYGGEIYYNNINIKLLDMYNLRKDKVVFCEQKNKINKENLITIKEQINKYEDMIFDIDIDIIKNIDTDNDLDVKSGGELQKLSLLSALKSNKEIIILDEPTTFLDVRAKTKLKESIKKLKDNKIIIIIDHTNNFDDIADLTINL